MNLVFCCGPKLWTKLNNKWLCCDALCMLCYVVYFVSKIFEERRTTSNVIVQCS